MTATAGGALAQTTTTTVSAAAAAPSAAEPDCFASVAAWLRSNPAACPLSAFGLTAYATIDMGGGYETHAAPFNGDAKTGVSELISKVNDRGLWQRVPSGLTASNFGVGMKEPIAPGWLLIGDVSASIDPYSLRFTNGPRSLVDNNNVPLANQSANTDSGRSTGWDNSRGYVGLKSAMFGTLTLGRQSSFSNDLAIAYDPFGGSFAFSALGNSSTFVAGAGDTELSHFNRSLKYVAAAYGVHAGALVQIGGYDQRNNATSAYQLDVGGEVRGVSVDALYSHADDAVSLSNYASGAPTPDTLKATLADIDAEEVGARYRWRAFTTFGGYEYARLSSPSRTFGATATATGGTLILNGGFPAVVQANAYVTPKHLQVAWLGESYAILDNLSLGGAVYYIQQNNYTNAATKYATGGSASKTGIGCGPNLDPAIPGAAPRGSNAAACGGDEYAVSAVLDWHVLKRLDLYTGVMYSEVSGGLANGFIQTDNTAFTTGVRVAF